MLFASRVARRTKSRTSYSANSSEPPQATGLWRVPGAHVAAMGASFGDRVGGAVSVHSLEDKKGAELHGMIPSSLEPLPPSAG